MMMTMSFTMIIMIAGNGHMGRDPDMLLSLIWWTAFRFTMLTGHPILTIKSLIALAKNGQFQAGKFGVGQFQQKLGIRSDTPPPWLGQNPNFGHFLSALFTNLLSKC